MRTAPGWRRADLSLLPDIANALELFRKSPAATATLDLSDLVVLAARSDRETEGEPTTGNRVE